MTSFHRLEIRCGFIPLRRRFFFLLFSAIISRNFYSVFPGKRKGQEFFLINLRCSSTLHLNYCDLQGVFSDTGCILISVVIIGLVAKYKMTKSTLLFPRSFHNIEVWLNILSVGVIFYFFSPWNTSGLTFLSALLISQLILKFQYAVYPLKDFWTHRGLNILEKLVLVGLQRFIEFWHNFEVHDLEKVRSIKGSRLLLGYHTRNTIDLMYLIAALKPKILVSHLFFKVPITCRLLPFIGFMPSKDEASFVDALLESDKKPLMLLPGGVLECLKPYRDQYRVTWKDKPGFARVIHEQKEKFENGVSVVPFYMKNCERIYFTTASWYEFSGKLATEWYHRFRKGEILLLCVLMSLILFSWGFGVLPVPVKLDTYFGKPITLKENESVEDFSRRINKHLEQMMDIINHNDDPEVIKTKIEALDTNNSTPLLANENEEQHLKLIEVINTIRPQEDFGHHLKNKFNPIHHIFVLYNAILAVVQNFFLYVIFLALIWAALPPLLVYYVATKIVGLFGFKKSKKSTSKKND